MRDGHCLVLCPRVMARVVPTSESRAHLHPFRKRSREEAETTEAHQSPRLPAAKRPCVVGPTSHSRARAARYGDDPNLLKCTRCGYNTFQSGRFRKHRLVCEPAEADASHEGEKETTDDVVDAMEVDSVATAASDVEPMVEVVASSSPLCVKIRRVPVPSDVTTAEVAAVAPPAPANAATPSAAAIPQKSQALHEFLQSQLLDAEERCVTLRWRDEAQRVRVKERMIEHAKNASDVVSLQQRIVRLKARSKGALRVISGDSVPVTTFSPDITLENLQSLFDSAVKKRDGAAQDSRDMMRYQLEISEYRRMIADALNRMQTVVSIIGHQHRQRTRFDQKAIFDLRTDPESARNKLASLMAVDTTICELSYSYLEARNTFEELMEKASRLLDKIDEPGELRARTSVSTEQTTESAEALVALSEEGDPPLSDTDD